MVLTMHAEKIYVTDLFAHNDFKDLVSDYQNYKHVKGYNNFNSISAFAHYKAIEDRGHLRISALFDNEKLVGFMSYIKVFEPHADCEVGFVETIFIKKEYRKNYKILYANLRERAKEDNLKGIYFSSPAENKLLQRFYKIQGLIATDILFFDCLGE